MKKVIAIVAGGYSSEHDVSLRSAEGILSFMDNEKYDSYVVDIEKNKWTARYGDELCPINRSDFSFTASDGQHKFDFAYITIHGTPGENGILQGYFDLIGIPYSTSDVLIESMTFNKFALNNFLRSFPELHVSDSIMVRKGEVMPVEADVVSRLGLPCFVKPNAGGSSFGVTKVKTAEALIPAIEKAMHESDEVLIEKIMVGTEITCGAYKQGGEVITFPITEVVTSQEFFDYDAKYNGKVSEITPARIAGNEQINMLEINTTPGMTATIFIPQQIRAAGRKPGDVLSEIIEGKF